jgi:hypothetical protein
MITDESIAVVKDGDLYIPARVIHYTDIDSRIISIALFDIFVPN